MRADLMLSAAWHPLHPVITCDYCGRDNESSLSACRECGTELLSLIRKTKAEPVPEVSVDERPDPRSVQEFSFVDAAVIEGASQMIHGFRRVDWAPVARWIEARVDPLDAEPAWGEATIHWLAMLRDDLGGDYSLLTGPDAAVLCDQPWETGQWIQEYCRGAATLVREVLGEAANRAWHCGVIVVVFSDLDDYYAYVSHYCPEGEQAASGGVFIGDGIPHIAFPWTSGDEAARTITHELAHQSVAHLPLPTWLNEGLALLLERRLPPPDGGVFGMGAPLLDGERAMRHAEFWNRDRIQQFWAGTSFRIPGDSNELSYSLAEILVNLLLQQCPAGAFSQFLQTATPDDSGQSASFDVLGKDLGEVVGTFLGPGQWRPQRKAIKECWAQIPSI